MLSDLWGRPDDHYNGHGPPCADPAGWTSTVRRATKVLGGDVVYDLWNEPDSPAFWSGTPDQLVQVLALAEHVLRAELGPAARLIGPSFARFDARRLDELLDGCAAMACRFDAVAIHAFPRAHDPLSTVARDVRQVRAISRLPVLVREALDRHDQDRPGAVVAAADALERAGAAGAGRGCLAQRTGDDCTARTLAGLLVDGPVRTTPAWWATKLVADGRDRRVPVVHRSNGAAGVAAACGPRGERPAVVLGRDDRARDARPWALTLSGLQHLPCLRGAVGRVRVTQRRVPHLGRRPLRRPELRAVTEVPVSRGRAGLRLAATGPADALLVELSVPATRSR